MRKGNERNNMQSEDSKSKKEKKQTPKKKVAEDLQTLQNDWDKALEDHELVHRPTFLHKIAEDIKRLNDDTVLYEEIPSLEPTMSLIHHLLATPMGAPFVADKTWLDAAIAYEYQDPLKSDLAHLMDEFCEYIKKEDNQVTTLLDQMMKELK
jgi:hypothetical protein